MPTHQKLRVTEPTMSDTTILTRAAPTDTGIDWSNWEKWLQSHLDLRQQLMIEGVGELVAHVRRELRAEIEMEGRRRIAAADHAKHLWQLDLDCAGNERSANNRHSTREGKSRIADNVQLNRRCPDVPLRSMRHRSSTGCQEKPGWPDYQTRARQ
jgi:hypothetical protein